jgi:hypothetical protein
MGNTINCPKCGCEFELSALMRAQLEGEVRVGMQADFERKLRAAEATSTARLQEKDQELEAARTQVTEAAQREAELLKRERELESRERESALDFERRVAQEAVRIREVEAKAAQERYGREADERVRQKDQELAEVRAKLGDVATKEAELLQKERELEERQREAALDVQRQVAVEAKRIREVEAKAAQERYGREADERVRQKDQELAEVRAKLGDVATKEAELLQKERELEERQREAALDVQRQVAVEAKRIREVEAKAAQERYGREADERVRQKDQELAEVRAKLGDVATKEAELLQKERELEERQREAALDVQRQVAVEAKRIRDQEAKLADERAELERDQQRLRDEEHRQQIEGLQRTISDLQRRVQQGSQQTQGEAQEVLLRDMLEEEFTSDSIEDVPKGVLGADVLHRVRAGGGRDCGSIVWESKRTKAWSDEWLPKLRDDQRAAGAACAVIVSQVLPANVRHFALVDGVWVCAWPYAIALGAALRVALVDVATARQVAEGRGEKMQMLFDYLTGTEFRLRVEGFVEAFREMQEDLESEKRAMLTRWNRRARLMQRARDNITAFYGDLQGIAGRQLRDLPALTLAPALPEHAGDDEDADPDEEQAAETEHPRGVELTELLFRLLPDDGGTTGNRSLTERFIERALLELGVHATAGDCARCKAALLAAGRIRKGKGRGGSVCRAAAPGVA